MALSRSEDEQNKSYREIWIAEMKNGRTRLAYKPEHIANFNNDVIVAVPVLAADEDVAKIIPGTFEAAEALDSASEMSSEDDSVELVAYKGYRSSDGLKDLAESAWKTRIAEAKPIGILRWEGDDEAEWVSYSNCTDLLRGVAHPAYILCSELGERGSVITLYWRGIRRALLGGRGKMQKRYLISSSSYSLDLIIRLLISFGMPRPWAHVYIGAIWLHCLIDDQMTRLLGYLFFHGRAISRRSSQNRASAVHILTQHSATPR